MASSPGFLVLAAIELSERGNVPFPTREELCDRARIGST